MCTNIKIKIYNFSAIFLGLLSLCVWCAGTECVGIVRRCGHSVRGLRTGRTVLKAWRGYWRLECTEALGGSAAAQSGREP
ncbi:hypothetical protein ES332_A09G228800v1 [Gossypium tomentosum]|uniref:Secreted protein n=1 Tax=Gossypium tomentosum TaxID=34277 RepID=A0A5D2P5V9_GOSTO|nr:hypothetical protein ES332_A09G228800v1 [Gossypium tomentosum]